MDPDNEKRKAALKRILPKDGFIVAAVDGYERDPEFELFLVGHYATKEEADAACAKRTADGTEKAYVFGPDALEGL